jgi:putative transposase
MIGQMRDIAHSAQRKTRKVRRDTERREHLLKTAAQCKPVVPVEAGPAAQAEGVPPAVPFDQIEEW